VASLHANAHDVLNPDAFTGLTDYIHYGLASRTPSLLFQRLFKTKTLSLLFARWRTRYHTRTYKHSLENIHSAWLLRQVLAEWTRSVQRGKLRVKEYTRTKAVQRVYSCFQRWARANKEIVRRQRREVEMFRKKVVLKAWIRYLEQQGN
jgi:hypothetical protein